MATSATTDIDIANMALTMLGQQTISDLTDETNRARQCDARLGDVRDTILAAHTWNCATKRASLTAHADAPAYGYAKQYPLPSDFIRLINTETLGSDYRLEAYNDGVDDFRMIVTNLTEMNISYVYRMTNVGKMASTLQQAFASRLASEIAKAVTGSDTVAKEMLAKYEHLVDQARYEDAAQHSTTEHITADFLTNAGHGGGVYRPYQPLNPDGSPV